MTDGEILKKFGQRVAELRKERKLSQEELAAEAGLNRTHIGMIERAEKNVSILTIYKVAHGLNVDIKDLF